MERGRAEESAAAATTTSTPSLSSSTTRPFTAMGSATFHLDALRSSNDNNVRAIATANRQLSTAGGARHERKQQTQLDGEFDVRKFILEQKGSEPLHQSALFRAAPFLDQHSHQHQPHNKKHTKSRASPRPTHTSSITELGKRAKTPRMLPKMALSGSRSTGSLPLTGDADEYRRTAKTPPLSNSSSRTSVNQHHDEHERDAVSHFYTVEKLAESCCHATQSRNKTWHLLPGSEERSKSHSGTATGASGSSSGSASSITGVERPSRRVDVLDLDKCFAIAMQFATTKNSWNSAGGKSSSNRKNIDVSSEKLAMLDRDLMAIETRISHKYASSSSRDHDDDLQTADPVSATTTDASASNAPPPGETERRATLVKLLFAQKWSDVVMGELEAMLTTSFLEQGVLLRNARTQYARAFFALETLFHNQTNELVHAQQTAERMQCDMARLSASHARDTDVQKAQFASEIAHLRVSFESEKGDMERKAVDAKDQMTRMSDTMKTLHTVFRQMREDTDKVKAVELRESFAKLEKKHALCRDELDKLRLLGSDHERLGAEKAALVAELATLHDSTAHMATVLAAKDDAIATLMEQQSVLLAAQELQTAALEAARYTRTMENDNDADRDDDERNACGRSSRRNSISVCVRCKQAMQTQASQRTYSTDDPPASLASLSLIQERGSATAADRSDAIDSDTTRHVPTEARKRRVQCLYYRILLPNLRGRRPQREIAWTLSCMRAIVFAKQLDDAMSKRAGGDSSAAVVRTRMPEFVYAWYAPWHSLEYEKRQDDASGSGHYSDKEASAGMDGNATGSVSSPHKLVRSSCLSVEQQQAQADEDRWCLYYGVRSLVQDGYLEAKLFLSLLDEKYGEDELVFMLYCYRVLDILIGGRLDYGPLRECASYAQFAVAYDAFSAAATSNASAAATSTPTTTALLPNHKRVPKTIWISPRHASLATAVVLTKATESERAALDHKIVQYAVTNVPRDERPVVFIPSSSSTAAAADTTTITDNSNVISSATHKHTNDKSNNVVVPLQQFVDANLWVELMMLEYKEEQAHRRAAIRLMFQTATSAAAAPPIDSHASVDDQPPASALNSNHNIIHAATMDMEQFRTMLHTLNDHVPSCTVATLFRNAYERSGGTGVHFDAFMDVADAAQFFSSCMRLASPAVGMARVLRDAAARAPASAALSTSTRAAAVVNRLVALCRADITTHVEALPLCARSRADKLASDLVASLDDRDGANADGVRLLTSFYRLVDHLVLAKLVQHEVTGAVCHSKTIDSIERALDSLLACMRLRDRSSTDILIDSVRQNVCVQRLQAAFRAHLRRDVGAPLAMRALLHGSYSRSDSSYKTRRAVRPLAWLLGVIAAILRLSLRPERHALLIDLSMTSSGFKATASMLNGSIGPAPRPVLLEFVYDFFLDKFGTRWEAEKLVHDVFVSCRAHARMNATAALFSKLCSMQNMNSYTNTEVPSDDKCLLGQNEALAFVHGVLRCGLHRFSLVHPPLFHIAPSIASDTTDSSDSDGSSNVSLDYVPLDVAEAILLGAFSRLDAEQQSDLRTRIKDAAQSNTSTGDVDTLSTPVASFTSPRIDAGGFLLLAATEWQRYVVRRLCDVARVCSELDADDLRHFAAFQHLDVIATVLQKSDVAYHTDDVCAIFRRFCATETRSAQATNEASVSAVDKRALATLSELSGSSTDKATAGSTSAVDSISERLAAACFPLLAREPLTELQRVENSAVEPFKLPPNPTQSYELLVGCWRGYAESCRLLLEDLRRVGKSNDILIESGARRTAAVVPLSAGASSFRKSTREALHLSSSTSTDRLSSQDVAQLEAVYTLFLERLERLAMLFENERLAMLFENERAAAASALAAGSSGINSGIPNTSSTSNTKATSSGNRGRRSSVVGVNTDSSLTLVDDLHAHTVMVNETWKIFRQVLFGFTRQRALAGLGTGTLPDVWTNAAAT